MKTWHKQGRTERAARAEKAIKSKRKIVRDQVSWLQDEKGMSEDEAIADLQRRFLVGSWGGANKKNKTLHCFIEVLKKERSERRGA